MLEDRTAQLAEVHAEVFPAKPAPVRRNLADIGRGVSLSDQDVIDKAKACRGGDKFARLWNGNTADYGDDDSAADQSLCNMLAFWCAGDESQMDRIFRSSGLYREKWDSRRGTSTYGQQTIDNALSYVTERYSGNGHQPSPSWDQLGSKPKPQPEEPPIKPQFTSIAELAKSNPLLREPVIEGLLRQGETMNVISVPKIGKSWLVLDLAISQATGRMWLGKYPTRQSKVLIIDNELHQQTIANRIPKVAMARGVMLSELSESLYVESLRGRLRDIYQMDSYFRGIESGQFGMIILDAFYRFLPRDSDENSNADLAAIYNRIDSYADRLGCCFVLIHHSSKGIQGGKAVTDVGSGAGAQSRAADSHLILRHHEQTDVVVLDAAVRSWAPVQPVCLRWDFPVWQPADDLDPTQLRVEGRRKRSEKAEEVVEEGIKWTPETFVETFLIDQPRDQGAILARASVAELSERKAKNLLQLAVMDGIAHRWEPTRKTMPVRYATQPQPVTDTGGVL